MKYWMLATIYLVSGFLIVFNNLLINNISHLGRTLFGPLIEIIIWPVIFIGDLTSMSFFLDRCTKCYVEYPDSKTGSYSASILNLIFGMTLINGSFVGVLLLDNDGVQLIAKIVLLIILIIVVSGIIRDYRGWGCSGESFLIINLLLALLLMFDWGILIKIPLVILIIVVLCFILIELQHAWVKRYLKVMEEKD